MGFQPFGGVFGNHSIKHLWKQKSEYHQRPCFEAVTSATNLNIRQIQANVARKASGKVNARSSMDFIATIQRGTRAQAF